MYVVIESKLVKLESNRTVILPPNGKSNLYLQLLFELWQQVCKVGGSPGLVVMGGDSRSEGRGFESQRHILDGLEKTENKRKRGRGWPIVKQVYKELQTFVHLVSTCKSSRCV